MFEELKEFMDEIYKLNSQCHFKKYELKLNKESVSYKIGVENKIYISKIKFKTEFQLYLQLSKSFTNMTKEASQLAPSFTKDVRDDYGKYKPQNDRVADTIISDGSWEYRT